MSTQTFINDGNIDSLDYSESSESLVISYKGGSRIRYSNISKSLFDEITVSHTCIAVLNTLRHNNIVGVRIK